MPALFLSFSISFRNPAFCLHLIYIFIILVKQPYCPSENHHRVHGIYFTICIYICTNRLYCIQTFNAHCRSQCHHCIQRIYLPIPINIAQCIPLASFVAMALGAEVMLWLAPDFFIVSTATPLRMSTPLPFCAL